MDRKHVQCLGHLPGRKVGELFDIIFTSYISSRAPYLHLILLLGAGVVPRHSTEETPSPNTYQKLCSTHQVQVVDLPELQGEGCFGGKATSKNLHPKEASGFLCGVICRLYIHF